MGGRERARESDKPEETKRKRGFSASFCSTKKGVRKNAKTSIQPSKNLLKI